MAQSLVPLLHTVAMVMSIIELGLTAYLVSLFNGVWASSPSQANFMLFNSLWSILVLAYIGLAPLYFARVFHPLLSVALQAVTNLFWFAGSVALAAALGGPCGSSACGSATAAIVFGFFLWLVFCVLNFVDFRELRGAAHEGKPQVVE